MGPGLLDHDELFHSLIVSPIGHQSGFVGFSEAAHTQVYAEINGICDLQASQELYTKPWPKQKLERDEMSIRVT